jgi:hypothetical protein
MPFCQGYFDTKLDELTLPSNLILLLLVTLLVF